MLPSLHCAVKTSHVTVLLSYLVVPFFFFLTFYGTILTLHSTNITCNYTFVTFDGSLFFFFFFSHLMVPSWYCVVPTSHGDCTFVTFRGSFIFSHIWWYHLYIVQYLHHMWLHFHMIKKNLGSAFDFWVFDFILLSLLVFL